MKAIATALLIGLAGLLVACGSSVQGRKRALRPMSLPPEPSARAEVIAGTAPNAYSVRLEWPPLPAAEKWVVHKRESGQTALSQVGLFEPAELKAEDFEVMPGKSYRYFISRLNGEQLTIASQVDVSIPTDLTIDSVREDLHRLEGINRLYLLPGAVVRSGKDGLTVRVNELHSESGIIESFALGDPARGPDRGSDAGPIDIQTIRAFGILGLFSRGQSGASGPEGKAGVMGAQGASGIDGEWGANPELFAKGFNRGAIEQSVSRMKRDRPAPGDPQWLKDFAFGVRNFACVREPSDGGRGLRGEAGAAGGNGTDGGNSGPVFLEVKEPSDFRVDIDVQGGLPGPGGRGGKGGAGGPGGLSGKLDEAHFCTPAKAGEPGEPGAEGATGAAGRPGLKEPVCVKVNGTVSEGCQAFKAKGA